jgi:hypothetical protein
MNMRGRLQGEAAREMDPVRLAEGADHNGLDG